VGGRILGLIKSDNHGWLNMMTSSEGPLFNIASDPPNPKHTTACRRQHHKRINKEQGRVEEWW